MLRLKLFITIIFMFVLQSHLATAQNKKRSPNQAGCPQIQSKGMIVELTYPTEENDAFLRVRTSDSRNIEQRIVSYGPTSQCRQLLFFPERDLIILDQYLGKSGTRVISETRLLFVYKISDNRLNLQAQFTIEETEESTQNNLGPVIISRSTYSAPHIVKVQFQKNRQSVTEKRVVFQIKDEKTGAISRHSY